jgi:hypothetical protein
MKRLTAIFAVSFVVLSISCKNLVTDLPKTDTSQFISGNTVVFPTGTRAIDVYNTVVLVYNDNEYHDVANGSWKYIKTTNTDGLTTQVWESVVFTKVKHAHIVEDSEINTHTVYLYSNDTNVKEIVFK